MKDLYARDAVFMANRLTIFRDLFTLKDDESRYYLVPDWSQGVTFRLLGYPLLKAPPMPLVAGNALPLVFANLKRGYTIVDRSGMSLLRDPFSKKPMIEFWFRKRTGGDVAVKEAIKIQKIST
jgi:HK97 family phage major capsid protein